jgi:hypothetical protein
MRQRSRWIGFGAGLAGLTLVVGSVAAVPAGASAQPKNAAAHQDLLRLSDLPTGWKVTKTTSTSSTSTASTNDFTEVASCEGTSAAGLGANVPSAQASFTHQQTAQFVFELVGVFPSTSTANRTYGFFSNAKAPTCVGQLLAKSIASGATGAGLTASKITTSRLPFPREGSATTALKLAIPLTVDGENLQMNADFIVIRSGKKIAVLAPVGLSTVLSTTFASSLAKKAADRLS